MTIIVSATVVSVGVGSAASLPLVGMSSGVGITAIGKVIGKGILSTIGGAVGASTSTGAIIGSASTGTVNGALAGGVAGAATSALLGLTNNIITGPVGWLVLGMEHNSDDYTFDCWKPVLRDESTQPSKGKLFRDVIMDRRIKQVVISNDSNDSPLPQIIVENIWNEKFLIQYITLPSQQLSLHALQL